MFGALLVLAIPLVAADAAAEECKAPPLGAHLPFRPGENYELELDVLGVVVGRMNISLASGPAATPYVVTVRGSTESMAATFFDVNAVARSYLTKSFEDRRYEEDNTETGVVSTYDAAFPVPADGTLKVKSTRQGNRDDFSVNATRDTRDMLAALYAVRTFELKDGADVCVPVFGARRLWWVKGKVMGREPVKTVVGDIKTVHIGGKAIRADSPKVFREVHLWLSDDENRMPVAAFGTVSGKPIRAQMVSYKLGSAPAEGRKKK